LEAEQDEVAGELAAQVAARTGVVASASGSSAAAQSV
jgi:hypothetical protein